MIAPITSASPSSASPVSLFISYRRSDSSDVVGRIYERLVSAFDGPSIFRDVDSIPLGLDFRTAIETQVSQCQVLLAVIGSTWLTVTNDRGERRIDAPGDWVRLEIESGLFRDIPIIPLLVRNARLPQASELPESIAGLSYRNGLPIRSDPDFDHDIARLVTGIREHLSQSSQVSAPSSAAANPRPRLRRSQHLRAEYLTRSLDDRETEYQAVSEQLRVELDPVRELKLQRQQEQLSQKMDEIEQELFELGALDE